MFPRLTKSEKWINDLKRYKNATLIIEDEKIKLKLVNYIKTFEELSNEIDVGHQSSSGGIISPRQLIDTKHNLFKVKEKIEVMLKQLDN